jgi:hypothetical protein
VIIRKTIGATQLVEGCQLWVEFCTRGCGDRNRAHEAQESSLLEAVAKEWLMTQQAGKGLTGAVVICKVWRIAT